MPPDIDIIDIYYSFYSQYSHNEFIFEPKWRYLLIKAYFHYIVAKSDFRSLLFILLTILSPPPAVPLFFRAEQVLDISGRRAIYGTTSWLAKKLIPMTFID